MAGKHDDRAKRCEVGGITPVFGQRLHATDNGHNCVGRGDGLCALACLGLGHVQPQGVSTEQRDYEAKNVSLARECNGVSGGSMAVEGQRNNDEKNAAG